MEKQIPQPQRTPLARDPDGRLIELPDSATGWRIRRQTGGRPRQHLDSKKQPMVFPLDYTAADAEDILPPGNYLLDAVDRSGDALGVTVALSVGIPRSAEPAEGSGEHEVTAAFPAIASEVRLVLEANVRSTQLAFLHNQRTLEVGLRMAETLRDAVEILARSQADWIKSAVPAHVFVGNGASPVAVEVNDAKQCTLVDATSGSDARGRTS